MTLNEMIVKLENEKFRHGEMIIKIKTSNKSIGASSSIDIDDVYAGFDWDNGILFINPIKELVLKELNRDKALEVINFNKELPHLAKNISKTLYLCRNCESFVAKTDNYCRNCGQKLKCEGAK